MRKLKQMIANKTIENLDSIISKKDAISLGLELDLVEFTTYRELMSQVGMTEAETEVKSSKVRTPDTIIRITDRVVLDNLINYVHKETGINPLTDADIINTYKKLHNRDLSLDLDREGVYVIPNKVTPNYTGTLNHFDEQ